NGAWRFVPAVGERRGRAAGYDLNDLDKLYERSRTYLYAGNRSCYTVNFGISEDDEPELIMRAYQFARGGGAPATPPTLKARLRKRILPRARAVRLANLLYRLQRRITPPKGNRILF